MSSEAISISDVDSIRATLAALTVRLDMLEGKTNSHPSFKTFVIADAAENEKACAFEPNDRPCDHCSMCTARGF
jgi:hypothetical protein